MSEYKKTPRQRERGRLYAAEEHRKFPEKNRIRRQKYRSSLFGRSLQLLDNARLRAKESGVPFNLTREWIIEALAGRCALTGREFDLSGPVDGAKANPNSPSVDRKDSARGYTLDNVRLLTLHANVARNQFSDADLLSLAHDIIRTISSQASQEEGSTTIPQGSRGEAAPKRMAPQEGGEIVSPLQ